MYTLFKTQDPENHTLFSDTYPSRLNNTRTRTRNPSVKMSITIMVLVITRRYDDLHCNTQVGALLHQDVNIKSGKLQLQVLEYFFYVL